MANGNGSYHDDAPASAQARIRTPIQDLDAPPPDLPRRKQLANTPEPPPPRVVPSNSARMRALPPARGDLRIGIIGTGIMAGAHADNFLKQTGCKLSACLDIDQSAAKNFAGKHHIAHVAKDMQDLIEHCDAIAIVTPDASHAAYAIQALRSNRHVLCEKPLTSTLAEARLVAKAAREAQERGVVGMVNFSYRCASAMSHAAWMFGQGRIGELRHVSAQYTQGWLCEAHEPSGGALWRMRRATGGGVLADLGCHLLDMVTGIVGDVKRVSCTFGNFPKVAKDGTPFTRWQGKPLDADDTALITLEFAGGGMGILQVSRWAAGRDNSIKVDVHGTRGALVFDLDNAYDQVHHHDVASKRWNTERPAPAPSGWERFIGAVRGGRHEQPDLIRGAQIQAYLDACSRSAQNGCWQEVERWE
jgi:predicted dehydrogenase